MQVRVLFIDQNKLHVILIWAPVLLHDLVLTDNSMGLLYFVNLLVLTVLDQVSIGTRLE